MSFLSDLFGGKKSKFEEYTPPDYTRLRDLLYNVQSQGYPEIMGESYWGEPWRQTGQDINEMFQAKKGLGASTPEYTQLQNARASLLSNLIGQNVGVRQNALSQLTNLTPRPTTTYTPESPGLFENLLGFAAPVASTALSGYLQAQNPLYKALSQSLLGNIKPKGYENWYEVGQPGQAGWNYTRV